LPTSNGTQGVMVFGNRTEVRATTAADNLQVREEAPPPSSPSGRGTTTSPCIPLCEGDNRGIILPQNLPRQARRPQARCACGGQGTILLPLEGVLRPVSTSRRGQKHERPAQERGVGYRERIPGCTSRSTFRTAAYSGCTRCCVADVIDPRKKVHSVPPESLLLR
jgi:hypothetical protein